MELKDYLDANFLKSTHKYFLMRIFRKLYVVPFILITIGLKIA